MLLAGLTVLGVVAAGGYLLTRSVTYTATAAVFISTGAASDVSDLSQGGTYAQQVVKSYADVASSPFVLDPVIKELGLGVSGSALSSKVSATVPAGEVIVELAVEDKSPTTAADIANGIARELSGAVTQLSPTASGNDASVRVTQIRVAQPPEAPSSPNYSAGVLLGGAIGLMFGILGAYARSRLDSRIRSIDEISEVSTLPLLGRVPFDLRAGEVPIVMRDRPGSVSAESYRTLRANMQFLGTAGSPKSVVVTSSLPGEGKSTTACNLAVTLAEGGAKVALVDADLRRPTVSAFLGLDGSLGLTDVLIGRTEVEAAFQMWGESGMVVLPAGELPPNPAELLQSEAMASLIVSLEGLFDFVIIDSPPLLAVSDAAILARRSSGAVLVCSLQGLRRPQLSSAISALDQLDASVFGLVATKVRRAEQGSSAYAYDYTA